MQLTAEQLIAVQENSIPICISAGAGSGKTRVLVEKFWQLIELGLEIDEILAMTFTRKAAWEMIERIRLRIDQSDLDPHRKRRLKEGLNNAWIGTIDGICSRIIRDYPIEAGIDPHFNIADEATINQLRYELAREIVLEKIEEKEPSVLEYIQTFGYYRIIDDMQTLLVIMTRKGLSLEKVKEVTWASINEVENNLSSLVCEIESVYDDIIACLPNMNKKTQAYAKVAQMAEDKEVWMKAVRNVGSLNFNEEDWLTLQKLHALGKGRHAKETKEHFEEFKSSITKLQGSIVDINNRKYLETLFKLMEELNDRLTAIKAGKNLLDYSDLEDRAIYILKSYPEILNHFQKQFKHVMVDEFQDTNYRQMELVKLISRDFNNCVFAVGDPKQSIYRFRGAQVNLFTEFSNIINHLGGLNHQLSNNFRTKASLIDFINSVFGFLMEDSKDFIFQPLVAARFCEISEHTELHLLKADEDLPVDAEEAEAYIIAQRIKEMVDNEERLVHERKGEEEEQRAVKYSDIAILFQKTKTMDMFTSVLSEYNIPYFVVGSRGFFTTEEVNTLLLALRVVADYYDEFAWIGILRSPMLGVSDETLWYLKQKHIFIYEALCGLEDLIKDINPGDYEVLLLARDVMDSIITNKSRLSLAEILEKIVTAFNYDLFLSCQPNGEQKVANIKKLMEIAKQHSNDAYDNIREFLDYVEKIKSNPGVDEEQAVIDSEDSDTVKLMTIHQSKGLEFPVVILPHIHQRCNTSDATDKIVFCDDIGLFINTEPKGFLRTKAEAEELRLILEEYKRLFYVAQTRARDYLIMVGNFEEKEENGLYFPVAPKNSWLNWLFSYYQVTDYSFKDHLLSLGINTFLYDKNSIEQIKEAVPLGDEQLSAVNLKSYAFKMPVEQDRYEYISATRLMDYQFCPFYAYLKHHQGVNFRYAPDEEIDEVQELNAANVGNIIHKVIEQTNTLSEAREKLNGVLSGSSYSVEGEELELLYEMLENYYEHDLIKELSKTSQVLKEVPFLVRLEDKVFLKGFIDQLWLNDEYYHVFDLKTGRTDFDNENYHLQVNLYKLALDKTISQKLGKKGIFYLRSNEIREVKDMDMAIKFDYNPSPQETSNCSICPHKHICFPGCKKEA